MTADSERRGSRLFLVLLPLVGIALALVVLEVAARLFHIGTGGFWEPHPLYGWRNIPNAAGWESCYGECEVYVEINSLGLRNAETAYQNTNGARRVLILGDSMTAAMQVPLDRTFASVLERGLDAGAGDTEWEVINAGVNAFGTDNELIYYRLEGKRFEPDIVVLAVYLANDVYNNSRFLETSRGGSGHKPYFELGADGELILNNYPVESADTLPIRVGTFLKRHFQLPRFVAQVLALRSQVPALLQPVVEALGGARGVEPGIRGGDIAYHDICSPEYSPQVEEAWAITGALIGEIQSEVSDSGAEFAVVALPASRQIAVPDDGESWYCDRANEELARILQEQGIAYLDLLSAFRQHATSSEEPLFFQRDFHMNSSGHQLAGERLIRFLVEEFALN